MRLPWHEACTSPALVGSPLHEVEQRFLVDPDEAGRFLTAIRPSMPLCLRDPARPIEHVRTTYYDTDELTLFRTRSADSDWRVRVRQYASSSSLGAPALLGAACALEVKEIAAHGRRKLRAVGSPVDVWGLLQGRRVDTEAEPAARCEPRHRFGRLAAGSSPAPLHDLMLAGPLAGPLDHARRAIAAGALRPRLTTWFRRLTYAGFGARVTVDQQIEFARPVAIGAPGELAAPADVGGHGPPLVLEIKLRVGPPAWLATAMHRLLVPTLFSKFRDGLLAFGLADHASAGRTAHPGGAPRPADDGPSSDRLRSLLGLSGPLDPGAAGSRATTGR